MPEPGRALVSNGPATNVAGLFFISVARWGKSVAVRSVAATIRAVECRSSAMKASAMEPLSSRRRR